MKGSDKKKLKVSLAKVFSFLSEKDFDLLLPTKDEIIMSKIFTFAGDSVLLYVHNKNAVFFELEKDKVVYPTVYTLWKYPQLVPSVTTWTPVMQKIANGADLMLPGIIVQEEKGMKAYCEGKLQKGDSISVNLVCNLAPIAIGTAHLSSEDMYMAARRGKGVNILHFYGDQLWAAGSREQVPDLGAPEMLFLSKDIYEGEGSDDEESEKTEETLVAAVDGIRLESDDDDDTNVEIPCDKDTQSNTTQPPVILDSRSSQEIMDELLLNSFLQSWKTTAKKIELPILTSNFFAKHMMQNCPPGTVLDVKKSSFKKLSKFLNNIEKEGVVKIKELQKGVESIVTVNLEHDKLKYFRVVKFDKVEEIHDVPVVMPCDRKYQPPKITELHSVTANVLKVFKLYNYQKGDFLTAQDIKRIIVEYAKSNGLQVESNKVLVKLDPILAEIVLGRDENNIIEMKYEDIHKRIIDKMSNGYSLQFPGSPPNTYKGQLEAVEMATATRSGNKKITLVNNLDVFKIDPGEFAHKCQVGVSASTSCYAAPNRKSGTEVMIQGNQISFATKLLLDEYKIPKKYIKCLEEKSKKKK